MNSVWIYHPKVAPVQQHYIHSFMNQVYILYYFFLTYFFLSNHEQFQTDVKFTLLL